MKKETKLFLDELILLGKKKFTPVALSGAYYEIGFGELNTLAKKFLKWPKYAYKGLTIDEDILSDYMIISDLYLPKFQQFFDLCDAARIAFQIKGNHLTFSDDLSEEDKLEIKKYVDENYEMKVRIRRRP